MQRRRVSWEEINIDTADDNLPDKEMANEDTSINDLYKNIEQKVSSVKSKTPNFEESETDGEDEEIESEEEGDYVCWHCGEIFELDRNEIREVKKKGLIKVECPNCHEITSCGY